MKLDHDYVRNLLLAYESSSNLRGPSENDFIELSKELNKTRDELVYTLNKLAEGNFVTSKITWGNDMPMWIQPGNLTFEGHKYLDNIRDPEVWKKTKKTTSKFASVSLDIISSVAAKVIVSSLNLG
ncbi:DUF2513 domain-containing protein [Liquorilactobacillus cacaonum]|uniref:DUF2513 domain-containing protein n=1 Tax=Liquorilactobacillus cacaonum DSM 21116 TaxID=1423729 RepID=A0A0R2CTT5_9LACO|nr:DUF2513 domain-containing protein [Liquorilactobacillus cacaonum]KRM91468.1 hypothetical protein FC80_GL000434 [Liquorilactobacillus cacaonum DSM 21116]